MILPTKSQIREEKSKERQLDIDQALSLARKIDAMRQTKETEERELAQFRKSAMDSIKSDIAKEMSKRDSLTEEVKILEDRKAKALKPLTEELLEIERKKALLKESEDRVSELLISIQAKERDLSIQQEQAHSFVRQTESALDSARMDRKEAADEKAQADSLLRVAELSKEKTDKEIEMKIKDIQGEEMAFLSRERSLKAREENTDKRIRTLTNKERFVNDRYDTLERSIKRIKNG